MGTNFVNQTAPPPTGVTPATTGTTTPDVGTSLDEKPTSVESNDNINNRSMDTTDNNAATVTDIRVTSSSETEQNKQLEKDIKDDEDASPTGENNDQENVQMDTSETENTNLVNNSNSDNSLSDGSKTKDDNLDTTNNNNSNKCGNSDSQ